MSNTAAARTLIPARGRLPWVLLAGAVTGAVAAAAAAIWAPLDRSDVVGPTIASTIDGTGTVTTTIVHPGSSGVAESIVQRDGGIVIVEITAALLVVLAAAVLVVLWLKTGKATYRRAAFGLSFLLLAAGFVGLITFIIGGVYMPIAVLLLGACELSARQEPVNDTDQQIIAA